MYQQYNCRNICLLYCHRYHCRSMNNIPRRGISRRPTGHMFYHWRPQQRRILPPPPRAPKSQITPKPNRRLFSAIMGDLKHAEIRVFRKKKGRCEKRPIGFGISLYVLTPCIMPHCGHLFKVKLSNPYDAVCKFNCCRRRRIFCTTDYCIVSVANNCISALQNTFITQRPQHMTHI